MQTKHPEGGWQHNPHPNAELQPVWCCVLLIKITPNPPTTGTSAVPWPWAAGVTVTNRGEHSDTATAPPVPASTVSSCSQVEAGTRGSVQRYLRKIVISGIPAGLPLPVPLATTAEGFPKALQDSSAEVTGRRWLEWGWQHGGPSERSLCVEVDRLDFSRQDLGNLHRDDLSHHFWVVHAHHVCLD